MEPAWFNKEFPSARPRCDVVGIAGVCSGPRDEYRKDFALFGYGRTRNRGISCIGCFIWTTEVCATFGNDCAGGEAVVVRGRRLLGRCRGIHPQQDEPGSRRYGSAARGGSPHAISDRVVHRAMGSFATNSSPMRIYTGWTISCPSNGALEAVTCQIRLPSSSRANHLWACQGLTSAAMGLKA